MKTATPTSPIRQRHAPEVRRALIIRAAQDIIAEQGYPAASARTVAARCGISPGTLTYHFPSVDALLVAALRDASADYTGTAIAMSRSLLGARDQLMSLIDAALPSTPDSLRNWRLWMEYWARASHFAELAYVHSERYAEWRSTFEQIISRGVASGEFRTVDAPNTALLIVALLDGLGLQAVIGDSTVTVSKARAILNDYVGSLRS